MLKNAWLKRTRIVFALVSCLQLVSPVQLSRAGVDETGSQAQSAAKSIVAVTSGDASGGAIISSGFFVKEDVVATSYRPLKALSRIGVKVPGSGVTEMVQLLSFDEGEDIALLKLPTLRGTGLPMAGGEHLAIGMATYVAEANDLSGSLHKGSLREVAAINDQCYLVISPEGRLAIGSPALDGRGKVIGIVVTSPEPDEHFSYCAHVSQIIAQIARTDGSPGGVQALRAERVLRRADRGKCIDGILGKANGPPPPPPPLPKEGDPEWVPTEPIRKSGGVLAESALEKVRPNYPDEAKEARVGGSVVVEVTIDEAGNVIKVRLVSGHPLLRDAAVEAARQWKFRPTTLSGIPVKVIGNITFTFNL